MNISNLSNDNRFVRDILLCAMRIGLTHIRMRKLDCVFLYCCELSFERLNSTPNEYSAQKNTKYCQLLQIQP